METHIKMPTSEILQKAIVFHFLQGQLFDFQVYYRVHLQVLVNQRNHMTSQSWDHILGPIHSELKTFPVWRDPILK